MKLTVTYQAGMGGSHSEPGLYRQNPVSDKVEFTVWRGRGNYPDSFVRVEDVCSSCGEQSDPTGYPCDCGPNEKEAI